MDAPVRRRYTGTVAIELTHQAAADQLGHELSYRFWLFRRGLPQKDRVHVNL